MKSTEAQQLFFYSIQQIRKMTNETEVLAGGPEITRREAVRIQGEILRRLAEVTQARAAECIGVDASTVSRMKASLEDATLLLAALGLQLVPSDWTVASHEDMSAYKRLAYKFLKHELEGKRGE